MVKKFLKNSERGQAIILIALAIVGMIGMVGLMTDGGILLIEYARLKRGIDAASIAAALQYRQGFLEADLEAAAEEFLRLNQSAVNTVLIETCLTAPGDIELCPPVTDPPTPPRKLVRVTATRIVTFGFMRVLGFTSTTISANSIGEAASIDLVLVMDTSASMAYETLVGGNPNGSDPGEDPADCNASGADGFCEPMTTVKGIAEDFIDTMFFPYDRVGIITMTSQIENGERDPASTLHLSSVKADVVAGIRDIRVYQPTACDSLYGPCRDLCTETEIDLANANAVAFPDNPCIGKIDGYYVGQACPVFNQFGNPSSCNSSNIGGGLLKAYDEFAIEPNREDSLWVVIMLVGGPANATYSDNYPGNPNYADVSAPLGYPDDPFAFGYCPSTTWASPTNPFCRDGSASTRHALGDPDYDADDYARDKADFVATPTEGGVTIFTIGLGDLVRGKVDTDNSRIKGDDDAGEKLLQYIALSAGDIYTAGVLTQQANHGEYYFSPDPAGLVAIFDAIAENIFTRISK